MTIPEPAHLLRADVAEANGADAYEVVRNLCASVAASGYEASPGLLLGAARVRPTASEADLENIPASGAVLVAAGAPYGTLEALAASFLLDEARHDTKVMADRYLAAALRTCFVASEPWDEKQGLEWLGVGGLLATFVEENGWEAAVRLARRTGAAIVPAAVVRARTPTPENGSIELRLGPAVSSARLARFTLDAEAAAYLCWRTRELAGRHRPALRLVPRGAR